ncbi:Predicted phospholipase, patatin/cPLA2 family [Ruminococcaceae bacterium YRB3002]|nr:Predicted phospholipase, patatin/cPLA2 family [Ruminococcaceae bacterium YRB3002]
MGTGLVLEGGSMRGLFTMGVLDTFVEQGIRVDSCVGVSAGVAFGCNYKSGQVGRVLRYNTDFCRDWRFKSWRSLIITGDLFGADFCYNRIPNELDPFDCDAFESNPVDFWAVVTDCDSGEAVYHKLHRGGDEDMRWVRASASMPIASHPVYIDGHRYLDGGLTDSIPLEFMEKEGFKRNIVVLTQPRNYVKEPMSKALVTVLRAQGLNTAADLLRDRHILYNRQTEYVGERESEGAALVLAPSGPLNIGTLEREPAEFRRVYDEGVRVAVENLEKVRDFVGM